MNKPILEACVDCLSSAVTATEAGADRLELCGQLPIGGVTPSPALFEQVRRACPIPVNVLIRPRFGDFLYSAAEVEQMAREIELFRDLGADGVVVGALTPDGQVNAEVMKTLMAAAGGLPVTFHRAFDMTRDPFAALEDVITLGCRTLLTSGQGATAEAGKVLLKELCAAARGRITILAGSGVNSRNIQALHDFTGITAFHASGKKVVDSGMVYRKAGVSMGLPSLSEYERWLADGDELAACARMVHSL